MEEEMVDVDVTEISLDNEEIDELVQKLQELKQTKTQVSFDLDEDNELSILHDDYDKDGGQE